MKKKPNKKFGEIATFSRGLTFSKADVASVSANQVLRSNNIDLASHSLCFDDIACLKETFIIPEDKKLHKGDIFICMSNGSTQHLGKVAYVSSDLDFAFGGFMGAIHPITSIVVPRYTFYACLSGEYRRFLASILNGVNINNLKWTDLSQFDVPVPSLAEQERIVAELDLLTEIIDKQKAQLKELDTLAQSIFYDMFGDPVENEKGWDVKKLSSITTKIGSGATPKGGNESYKSEGISLIRSLNVHNNEFLFKDLAYIDDEQANALNNVEIKKDDVLLNITGASVARCCIVPNGILPARVNQHVCIIRTIADKALPIYINRLLTNEHYQMALLSLARSKAATREALPKSLVDNLPIPLPPLSLQQSFADKIIAIEQQKAAITQSIAETQKLFDYTMDKYFG